VNTPCAEPYVIWGETCRLKKKDSRLAPSCVCGDETRQRYPSRWMWGFAWRHSSVLWRQPSQRSFIAIRARSLPATILPAAWKLQAFRSVGMDADEPWTTSLWSDWGEASKMRRSRSGYDEVISVYVGAEKSDSIGYSPSTMSFLGFPGVQQSSSSISLPVSNGPLNPTSSTAPVWHALPNHTSGVSWLDIFYHAESRALKTELPMSLFSSTVKYS
jgi:hypothetical protein